MIKKSICLILSLMLMVSLFGSNQSNAAETGNFSDLPSNHWAYPYVQYMAEEGIINGYPDGTFKPDEPFSRAAFAKLLYLTFELEAPSTVADFVDLPQSDWAYDYIQGAMEYLTYYDVDDLMYFKPTEPTVREDVAVAMVVASGVDELYTPNYDYLNSFDDYDLISPQLRDFVALAAEVGIMKGSGSSFNPQGALTRAEACTVFARFVMEIRETLPSESVDGQYYVLSEVLATEKGAYYNDDTNWKKAISLEPEEAVVQLYDADFNRGLTDDMGYDVRGTIRWGNIPEVIEPNTTYLIDLSLELSKNYNPEEAYIEILTAAFDLHLYSDNTPYYGVYMMDVDGYSTLSAGLMTEEGTTMGGDLELIYNSPEAGLERIAIKIESGEGFEYLYIYEWVE